MSLSLWLNQGKRRTPSPTKAKTTHRDASFRFCWRRACLLRGVAVASRGKSVRFALVLPTQAHTFATATRRFFDRKISKGVAVGLVCSQLARQRCAVLYQPPCTGTTALPKGTFLDLLRCVRWRWRQSVRHDRGTEASSKSCGSVAALSLSSASLPLQWRLHVIGRLDPRDCHQTRAPSLQSIGRAGTNVAVWEGWSTTRPLRL